MAPVILVSAWLCSAGFVAAILLGLAGNGAHLMVALCSAIVAVAHHSLIFAIFTGSGKDTRDVVGDLSLKSEYVAVTKAFKRTVFPPALYSILFVLFTVFLGGVLTKVPNAWVGALHGVIGVATFIYNLKAFRLECRAVKENAAILRSVNRDADRRIREGVELQQPVDSIEWGQHVFALGKFLCFLGYNVWLVYLYLRWIMGILTVPVLPFALFSALGLLGGYYLRLRYFAFRPQLPRQA